MKDKEKKAALELLSYMIEVSQHQDVVRNTEDLSFVGVGWMTFHLNRLKELIDVDA